MAAYKLATSIQFDSMLPRDAMMINPVINDVLGGENVQQLVDDWVAAISTWATVPSSAQVTVKAYECKRKAPGEHLWPVAEKVINAGLSRASSYPREVALCLSFYSDRNIPRQRGRLYIPANWMLNVVGAPAARPTQAYIDKVASLVPILTSLGGVDDDWSVYSAADDQTRKVTHWFVDNEWDTQRRRGLKSNARTVGTTTE